MLISCWCWVLLLCGISSAERRAVCWAQKRSLPPALTTINGSAIVPPSRSLCLHSLVIPIKLYLTCWVSWMSLGQYEANVLIPRCMLQWSIPAPFIRSKVPPHLVLAWDWGIHSIELGRSYKKLTTSDWYWRLGWIHTGAIWWLRKSTLTSSTCDRAMR